MRPEEIPIYKELPDLAADQSYGNFSDGQLIRRFTFANLNISGESLRENWLRPPHLGRVAVATFIRGSSR